MYSQIVFLDLVGAACGSDEAQLIVAWVLCSEIAHPLIILGMLPLHRLQKYFRTSWGGSLFTIVVRSQYSGEARLKDTCPPFSMLSYRSKMKAYRSKMKTYRSKMKESVSRISVVMMTTKLGAGPALHKDNPSI